MLKTLGNYKMLNNKCIEWQTSICMLNCQNGLFKNKDFFYMRNDGSSLCELMNVIQYTDYIGTSNVFWYD